MRINNKKIPFYSAIPLPSEVLRPNVSLQDRLNFWRAPKESISFPGGASTNGDRKLLYMNQSSCQDYLKQNQALNNKDDSRFILLIIFKNQERENFKGDRRGLQGKWVQFKRSMTMNWRDWAMGS